MLEWNPTYRSWAAMKQRCLDPNSQAYARYGGRGISICERWRSFENFVSDMGERPAGLTIDRIDPDGNYEPRNCRWATMLQQNHNRTSTKLSIFAVARIRALAGLIQQKELARYYRVNPSTVSMVQAGKRW